MKDDRNNWKEFCEERKKSLEQTIRKLEKQQKEEARFLRSLLELDGTARINAELAEGLIEVCICMVMADWKSTSGLRGR